MKGEGKEQVSSVTSFFHPLLQTNTLLISFIVYDESEGEGGGKGRLARGHQRPDFVPLFEGGGGEEELLEGDNGEEERGEER